MARLLVTRGRLRFHAPRCYANYITSAHASCHCIRYEATQLQGCNIKRAAPAKAAYREHYQLNCAFWNSRDSRSNMATTTTNFPLSSLSFFNPYDLTLSWLGPMGESEFAESLHWVGGGTAPLSAGERDCVITSQLCQILLCVLCVYCTRVCVSWGCEYLC